MPPAEPPTPAPPTGRNPIAALRQFARSRPPEPAPRAELEAPPERCDLCAAPLAPEHQHLFEPLGRRLSCACDPCAVLFSSDGTTKYLRVPRRVEAWPDFRLSDERWADLGVPISLAFFFHCTPARLVLAVYPSPAGATESPMAAEAWDALVEENPRLAALEPDVEALLVYRVGGARAYYRAPIDVCYTLVGIVRTHWRGLSGGTEVWRHIAVYFDALDRRAVRPKPRPAPAGGVPKGGVAAHA